MSINSGLVNKEISIPHKIIQYIEATKEYGKPSEEALEYFWYYFGKDIENNKFLLSSTDRDAIDNKWLDIVEYYKDTTYSGGFNFFVQLYKHQININNIEDLRVLVNKYKYVSVVTYDFKEMLLNLKDSADFDISDYYVYINNALEAEVALKTDDFLEECIVINGNGHVDYLRDADLIQRLKQINFVKKYMGTELNVFGYFPKTEEDKDTFTNLLLEKGIIKDNASVVKEADHAKESDSSKQSEEADVANVASGLTEEGSNELFNKFMDSLMEEDSLVMGALAKKTYEIQKAEEKREKHTYKFNSSYGGNFTTVDIYNDSLLEKANDILNRSGRLLIIGETGSGKSELAYKLISEITGEPIGVPTGSDTVANYNRVCIANARNGYSFWYEDDSHATIGKLKLFVEHIRKNNITEPCVFVGNEIQSSDFGYLMGDALFDAFNTPARVDEELLPSNLYIVFIGCNNRNFGIDDQVYGRVEHVRLEYLAGGTSEGEVIASKIIKNLGGDNLERAKQIVNIVSKINSNEKDNNFAAVISTRELIKKLKGQKTALVAKPEDKESLTNESKKLLGILEKL